MKAIPRKQRAMVRKGIEHGLTIARSTRTPGGCIASMPRACAISARRCFPRRYFRVLKREFGDDCDDRHGARQRTQPVSSRDEFLFPRRGAALLRRRHARGARSGGQRFHVLGSDAPRLRARLPAVRFRPQQGRHRRLRLQAELGLRAGAAALSLSACAAATSAGQQSAQSRIPAVHRAWKRLPLPVANLLGPPIVRGLG